MFCWDPILFISAIFEISSMLVDTENLLLSLSSTWAIIVDDVKWAYFFCHEYVSSDNSFLRRRLAGRFAAAGRKSEGKKSLSWIYCLHTHKIFSSCPDRQAWQGKVGLHLPSTSLAGAEYVGSFIYCAGELCKHMIGNDGLSVRWTRILEHSKEISKRVNWTWSWRDVRANPLNVSHTIIVLSSLPDTAVVPASMKQLLEKKTNLDEFCYVQFTVRWHLNTCDGPQMARKRVNFFSRVQIPDNQIAIFWSGYHLTFMGDRHSDS